MRRSSAVVDSSEGGRAASKATTNHREVTI
jgi:hypothetical protein